MTTTLKVSELCYLLRVLDLGVSSRHTIEELKVDVGRALTEEQIDQIRDLCGERLQAVGFNEAYQPTEEGQLLEALIDKLYVGGARK